MTSAIIALTVAAAICGCLHIWTDYRGPRLATYVFKPATMILIAAMLAVHCDGDPDPYTKLIIAGLLFSLMGDIFLMLPAKPLLPGLGSFLVAHVLYVLAFAEHAPLSVSAGLLGTAVVLAVAGAFMLLLLWDYFGRLRIPGLLYMAAILAMCLFAMNRWLLDIPGAGWAVIGAAFFLVSDGALALNRFRQPWRSAQLLILSTYYIAQWFIAMSVVMR